MSTSDWTWSLVRARNDDGALVGKVLHIGGDYGQAFCGQWTGYGAHQVVAIGARDLDWLAEGKMRRFGGRSICQRCLRSWKAL